MIGKTVSHYRILEKLGEGGMGVVYKARDIKLDRLVALKFLPPQISADEDEKKRFIHEAKAASALDHPNICSVYEINETPEGQLFISMGYYEGKTLSEKIRDGPLPLDEAFEIARQIAEGMKKAHGKGIVHRDLKPANVMLTDDGTVKIVDFGLAKLRGMSRLTKTGTTMGTVAYMSPEQTMGKEVDQRTDIWSLGVILYEMLAGKAPFRGDYEQAVTYAIINEEPEPLSKSRPDIQSGLENIVSHALAKNPANRYQTMEEFLADLRAVAEGLKPLKARRQWARGKFVGMRLAYVYAGLAVLAILFALNVAGVRDLLLKKSRESIIRSIAVLPFANFSGDPSQEYFSDGMTDELITSLSKIGALKVISRTSTMPFKGTKKSMREIAATLGVDGVLEGSVLRSGTGCGSRRS